MSGNPFRRAANTNEAGRVSAAQPQDGTGRHASHVGRVKRVQFVSPPQSPDDSSTHNPFPNGAIGDEPPRSPPPQAPRFSGIDTAALLRGEVNLGSEVSTPVEQALPASIPQAAAPGPTLSQLSGGSMGTVYGNRAPINPFARTLATLEPQTGAGSLPEKRSNNASGPPGAGGAGAGALDVDAFKRLLLTGNAGPTVSALSPQKVESGSSTDTSSASKQSIFEPLQELHTRSSSESSRSDVEHDDNDERSSLMGDPSSKSSKPSTPQHRHGQPLPNKGPQTVSFDDFDSEFASPAAAQSARVQQLATSSRPTLNRSTSDLNKPLPPPPPAEFPSPEPLPSDTASNEIQPLSIHTGGLELGSKKMPPPPPPVSRRTGQSRTSPNQGRLRSGSDMSQTPSDVSIGDEVQTPRQTNAPPMIRPVPVPSSRSSSISLDRPPPGLAPDVPAPRGSSKLKPPLPPRRGAAKPTPPLSRNASIQSTASANARRVSPNLSAPPPPPPPRRSDTKRGSYDGASQSPELRRRSSDSRASSIDTRRFSGPSFDASEQQRRDSINSLQRVAEGGGGGAIQETEPTGAAAMAPLTKTSSGDILADMEKFQQEIEQLRLRSRKEG